MSDLIYSAKVLAVAIAGTAAGVFWGRFFCALFKRRKD